MDASSNQRPAGDYTRNDVLFGRGGGINVHPGKFNVVLFYYMNSCVQYKVSLRFLYVLT